MARIRTIKPEFPQSESMGRVKREARLCFILLFTLADDAGRLRGNSRMLASLLYPYDDDAKSHIEGWLNELHRNGCIQRYEVDGDQYIEICKWLIHQKIDKPSPSKIPPPTEDSRLFAKPREDSSADQGEDQGVDQGREKPRKRVARPDDVDEQVWDDWMALRKAKRAPVTETVLKGAKSEAAKAGLSLDDFLRIWCRRGSQGLEASWIKEHELPARPTFAQQAADVARVTVPAKQGPDPTLQRLIEAGLKAVPPPPDVRQKLAALRVSPSTAPQKDGAE